MTGWRIRGKNGAAEILGLKPTTLESRMAKLGIRRRDRGPRNSGGSLRYFGEQRRAARGCPLRAHLVVSRYQP